MVKLYLAGAWKLPKMIDADIGVEGAWSAS